MAMVEHSRHFTRKAAKKRAAKRQKELGDQIGKSSGWKRIDYVMVKEDESWLRKWVVYERSL